MEDLIACLYPFDEGGDGFANRAVSLPQNRSRLLASVKDIPELQGRSSRESTAAPEDCADEDTGDYYGAGLQLTFTYAPKAGPGFVLGTDPNSCDIVLPPLPRISRRHCFLTFNAERQLIVRDCSTQGTIVRYDGKGGEKRRHFRWIIGGHPVPDKIEDIVIQLDIKLKFRIVVSKPSFPDTYFDNVDQFLGETAASANLPFGALGIQSSTSTVAPSGTQTPSQDPILLEQETLGKGAFSVVTRVWDVSTGVEYASKMFNNPWKSDWKTEALLMRQISHEQLVRLYFVVEEPHPQLILEYLPLGSLHQQHYQQSISEDEVVSTLQQGLSALTYLHEQTPPIVHRDIKPENILVQSRDPFRIKLGDFGLSKASEELVTFCGTLTYLAPELARYVETGPVPNLRYTHAVDIWSFGVVIFEYFYGLPPHDKGAALPWCEKIVKQLNDEESDSLIDLLLNMIVLDPQGRNSARACLDCALELDCPNRPSTPKPIPVQQIRTRSTITAVKLSTCELDALRAGHVMSGSAEKTSRATIKAAGKKDRSKRQRSSDGRLGEHSRSTKSFLHMPFVSSGPVHSCNGNAIHKSVLKFLADIQSKEGVLGIVEPWKPVLMDALCRHLKRLNIAELRTHIDYVTERTIITAVAQSRELTIASFTSSDLAHSVADLAQCLTHILELMSPDPTTMPSQDKQEAQGSQQAKNWEDQIDSVGSKLRKEGAGSPKVATSQSCDKKPADRTRSWSTASDRTYPVTFPSDLLDDINIPGCAPPTPY